MADEKLKRTAYGSMNGGPLTVEYAAVGGMVSIELPHTTTRNALARRLRVLADAVALGQGKSRR